MGYTFINAKKIETTSIRLCKWLKQLDSKLSPVKGFMGSNPLSMEIFDNWNNGGLPMFLINSSVPIFINNLYFVNQTMYYQYSTSGLRCSVGSFVKGFVQNESWSCNYTTLSQ